MPLLDSEAKQRIERAIAEVEQRTAGEFVVVSVRASDRYHALRLAYACAIALSGAATIHLFKPRLAFVWLLWLELGFGLAAWLLSALPPLLRVMLPSAYAAAHVERRAHEAFLAHEVFATRERSGVLILISELERKVAILGDSGIHAAVQISGWQEYVAKIVAAIRAGRPADGVCEVIAALGERLAAGLPRRADDRDELPNAVSEERE